MLPPTDTNSPSRDLNPQHPWFAFAHPDHQVDELEPLVRTLRYALIDLQKFWVEVQSIPVFMSGLKACSMDEIERIFQWVISSPPWNEKIQNPRLVNELAETPSRKKIQEFARTVICIRSILEELGSRISDPPRDIQGLEALWNKLSEMQRVAQRQNALETRRSDLDECLRDTARQWEEVRSVERFFERVSAETGAPVAQDATEGLRVLQALECVAKMPENVRPWRTRTVLDPAQKIRLQAWRDRAKPVLELRRRLETFFKLEAKVTIEDLRNLSDALKDDRLFSQLKAPYREAVARYKELLRDRVAVKVDGKNSGFQKAEKLSEWISLIEQTRAFVLHAEARQAFAPHFRGIDTDFTAALEANAWAQSLRDELFSSVSETRLLAFDTAILDFITQIPEDRIPAAVALIQSDEVDRIRQILETDSLRTGGWFSKIESERKKRCWDYRKLRELAADIGLTQELPLQKLSEAQERVEEAAFLLRRIESDGALKASLKDSYAGLETDLGAIEPCAAYVKAVRNSGLPEAVESSLLSSYGPQRLDDARMLVGRCLLSMSVVHEHFRKLETSTREQIRILSRGKNLEYAPIVDLMDRIQMALKDAKLLSDSVAELRRKRDARRAGLKLGHETGSSAMPQSL